MRTNRSFCLVIFFTLFLVNNLFAQLEIEFEKPISIRRKNQVHFSEYKSSPCLVKNGDMVKIAPRFSAPLATDSVLLVASKTLTLFPGALVKNDNNTIVILSGRVAFSADNSQLPIRFAAKRFAGEYIDGSFVIEVTADNGVYMAMHDNGSVWIKDENRSVFQLRASEQLHIPLFGETEKLSRLSSRWQDPPEGFAVARSRQISEIKQIEDIASMPVELEGVTPEQILQSLQESESNQSGL